jgi:two-component system response regulator MprA
MPTVLIADDDAKLIDMLRRTLSYEGYRVVTAEDGVSALKEAAGSRPDLVVLDWMMPGMDGITVAQRLRSDLDTPILMLTARDTVSDRVTGLDSGADDYLVKPFAPAELLARVRALLRRRESSDGDRPLVFADLWLDPLTRDVRRGERTFQLRPKEYDLLVYFLRYPRRVLPRERILRDVWGVDFDGFGNVLDVYVGYLRERLEAGGEPRLIQTVRGVGFILRES